MEHDQDSPTGFTSFNDYFNTNAGAARHGADQITQGVNDAAGKAGTQLAGEYGAFKASPDAKGFNPTQGLRTAYQDAEDRRNATGSTGGVKASLGGRATGLDAMLTQHAGDGFEGLRKQYEGLDTALGGAQTQGLKDVADRDHRKSEADKDAAEREAMQRDAYNQYLHGGVGHHNPRGPDYWGNEQPEGDVDFWGNPVPSDTPPPEEAKLSYDNWLASLSGLNGDDHGGQ